MSSFTRTHDSPKMTENGEQNLLTRRQDGEGFYLCGSPSGYLHDVLETLPPPSIRPSGICLQAWHASRKHNFSDFAKRATKVALLRRAFLRVG